LSHCRIWVIVIALTGPLAGKLQGAEKNDSSAYLPASARLPGSGQVIGPVPAKDGQAIETIVEATSIPPRCMPPSRWPSSCSC
jgi:hypothetical protein